MGKHSKLLTLIMVFAVSFIISSCSQKTGNSTLENNSLNVDEMAYYTDLKSAYYRQRFTETNTNIYYSRDAYSIGAENPESPIYNAPDAVIQVEVNSIEDLKVFYVYYIDENICIVSFKYQEMGESGAWFSIGAHIHFVEETKICDVVFRGNNFAPEVFYKGKFYYIQEAYKLGLFAMDNPNMILTDHSFNEKDGQNIEYISGQMPGTLINY